MRIHHRNAKALAAAILLLFAAISSANEPNCGSCEMFVSYIKSAVKEGNRLALLKLKHDLVRTGSLPEVDRSHLFAFIDVAIAQVPDRETPAAESGESKFKATAEKRSETRDVPTQAGIAPISHQPQSSDTAMVLATPPVAEDAGLDYCRRVVTFAKFRNDIHAIEALEAELPVRTDLTDRSRATVRAWIDAFRKSSGNNKAASDPAARAPDGVSFVQPAARAEASQLPGVVSVAPAATSAPVEESENLPVAADRSVGLRLPDEASNVFSNNYLRLRKRYLEFFLFRGITSSDLDVASTGGVPVASPTDLTQTSHFRDQGLHMGQALLTFAVESRLLKMRGISTAPSEAAIALLLDGFEEMDAADDALFQDKVEGNFMRDAVTNDDKHGVPWKIDSDLQKAIDNEDDREKNGSSLDQITSLFVGWWAVAKYSSSTANVELARLQTDRVMKFLIKSNFRIRLRNGSFVSSERGGDCRFAAGFLCQIANRTTGKPYFVQAQIELSEVSGKTIRFRDDNLGEFEIPEYKFPLTMPIAISHPALISQKPLILSTLSTPPTISIRLTDLIPEANHELTLPCAHLTAAHPGGDKVTAPCLHMTAKHPGGDPGPVVACTHLTPAHPGGHDSPCAHMTAKHPGGDAGPVVPCTHIVKLHDKHTIEETVTFRCPIPSNPGRKCTKTVSTDVPCTHFGPQHPGGHPTNIPCVHLVPAHPGGHNVPCAHMTAAHPGGHPTTTPCIHLVPAHPGGHATTTPCIHIVPAHSGGHKFDLEKLNVEIPLFQKQDKSFARHIMLQCLAFEPTYTGVEFVPSAIGSNHSWSMLLRLHAMKDLPPDVAAAKAAIDLHSLNDGFGPSGASAVPWAKTNRWERCTDLQPTGVSSSLFNGLDFLSLEGMTLLIGSP